MSAKLPLPWERIQHGKRKGEGVRSSEGRGDTKRKNRCEGFRGGRRGKTDIFTISVLFKKRSTPSWKAALAQRS